MCRHTSQSSPEFDGKIIEWSIPQIERTRICILFQLERFLIPYVSQPIRYARIEPILRSDNEASNKRAAVRKSAPNQSEPVTELLLSRLRLSAVKWLSQVCRPSSKVWNQRQSSTPNCPPALFPQSLQGVLQKLRIRNRSRCRLATPRVHEHELSRINTKSPVVTWQGKKVQNRHVKSETNHQSKVSNKVPWRKRTNKGNRRERQKLRTSRPSLP